jgi:choline-glycine betaine transporter
MPNRYKFAEKNNFERAIPAKFGLIWFSIFRGEDLNKILNQNMPNLHNLYKSAERKISQKNQEYMFSYSMPCSSR